MPSTAAGVAALLVVRDGDPGEQQEEGDVDADLAAEEAADRKGPGHRTPLARFGDTCTHAHAFEPRLSRR